MNLQNLKNKKILLNICVSLIFLLLIRGTRSYFSVYVLISSLSIIKSVLVKNNNYNIFNKSILFIFSLALALFVTLANYDSFARNNILIYCVKLILCFVLLFYIFLECITFFDYSIKNFKLNGTNTNSDKVFFVSFAILLIFYLTILFLSQYPGEMAVDSLNQIGQIISGKIRNNHPYWHTRTIGLFYSLGLKIFGNSNDAIATFTCFQIATISLIISFGNKTLRQLYCPTYINYIFILFYILMPYHISYSMNIWKDTLFSYFMLLMIVCLIRLYKCIGKRNINLILLFVSIVCVSIYRHNGFFAVFITFIFAIVCFKNNWKIIITIFIAIIFSYLMTHQFIYSIDVSKANIVETLSIPIQQISRVIKYDNDLSDNEIMLLSNIVDVEKVADNYNSTISDPIKIMIKDTNNESFIEENKLEFLKLYLNIGLRHPLLYLEAYIKQTRGYYSGGYKYWIYINEVYNNSYGIYRASKSQVLTNALLNYYKLFDSFVLQPFISTGLIDWIIVTFFCIGIIQKEKMHILMSLPLMAIIIPLLVGTPVVCEFRYIYSIYTTIPFMLLLVFLIPNNC